MDSPASPVLKSVVSIATQLLVLPANQGTILMPEFVLCVHLLCQDAVSALPQVFVPNANPCSILVQGLVIFVTLLLLGARFVSMPPIVLPVMVGTT